MLDALDLALAHAAEGEATAAHLKDALGQINALLRDTLAQEGLERIDAAERPVRPDDPRRRGARPPDEPEDGDGRSPADDGPRSSRSCVPGTA